MPSSLHSTFHLARFELLRIARVPTVMGYFLGPLLVYSALIWGELQVFSLMEGERATEVYRIAVEDPELAELLAEVERLDVRDPSEATPKALDRSTIDAYVTRGPEGPIVHHATWSLTGTSGAEYVSDELEHGIEERARETYLEAGGTKGVWKGYQVKVVQPKGGDEQLFEKLLAVLVGLMAPLSVLVTASQPACAVFLSDREEGTAETLLTTRVPRGALAAGKVAAVVAGVAAPRGRAEALIERLDLGDYRDVRCGRLSTGNRQKVSIARALVHDPPILVLDEPTTGLDVLVAQRFLELVGSLRDERRSPESLSAAPPASRPTRPSPSGSPTRTTSSWWRGPWTKAGSSSPTRSSPTSAWTRRSGASGSRPVPAGPRSATSSTGSRTSGTATTPRRGSRRPSASASTSTPSSPRSTSSATSGPTPRSRRGCSTACRGG